MAQTAQDETERKKKQCPETLKITGIKASGQGQEKFIDISTPPFRDMNGKTLGITKVEKKSRWIPPANQ